MKKYIISIKEVYSVPVEVEAETKEEAIKMAEDWLVNHDDIEPTYDYTLEPDEWTVVHEEEV